MIVIHDLDRGNSWKYCRGEILTEVGRGKIGADDGRDSKYGQLFQVYYKMEQKIKQGGGA